jgi:hypothetical protein
MNYMDYPRSPQPSSDHVVPHTVKGVIVYITPFDQSIDVWLLRTVAVLGSILVVYALIAEYGKPKAEMS